MNIQHGRSRSRGVRSTHLRDRIYRGMDKMLAQMPKAEREQLIAYMASLSADERAALIRDGVRDGLRRTGETDALDVAEGGVDGVMERIKEDR